MVLETRRKRREVRSKIAVLLAALGLVFGAVSCGGMEDMEDQEDQQEQQEEQDDD
jgi:sensor domain CHASE-containing protein